MKMTKKILAMLLSIAMIGCLFAGCNSNKTDDPNKTDNPATEEPTDKPTDNPTNEPTDKPTDNPTGDPAVNESDYSFEFKNFDSENMTCTVGAIIVNRDLHPLEEKNEKITEIVIPESYMGYKVTNIAWDIMGQKRWGGGLGLSLNNGENTDIDETVKKVVIPASVETIEYGAFFFGSWNIEEVVFEGNAANLKTVGSYAFTNTKWVREEAKKNGGYAIVNNILIYADPLNVDIVVPSNVKKIAEKLFVNVDGADAVDTITVNDGCEEIGAGLANGLKKLTKVKIPASVKKMGDPSVEDEALKVAVFEIAKDAPAEVVDSLLAGRCQYVYAGEQYSFIVSGFDKSQIDKKAKKVTVSVMINTEVCPVEDDFKAIKKLIVPETIGSYTVTGIGWDFMGQDQYGGVRGFDKDESTDGMDFAVWVEEVVFPKTIEKFEYALFNVSGGATIGKITFEGTDNLTDVQKFSFKRTAWETNAAFDSENSTAMVGSFAVLILDDENVVLPANTVTIIEEAMHEAEGANSDYGNVKTITINDGCKLIKKNAFEEAANCEKITIPASVEKIDGWIFKNQTKKDADGNDVLDENGKKVKIPATSTIFCVVEGSYAEQYATSYGYTVEYIK